MRKIQLLVITALTLFCAAGFARAEISIDQLALQAGISEGDVAVRESPRWNEARKILIWDIGIDLSALVESSPGVEYVFAASVAEAMQHAADVDAIVGFCDPELIEAAKNLVWLQIYWAGAERCLSVDAIADGSVVLTNMQKMSSPMIAEHAIAMIMSLARNLPQFVHAMDEGLWARQEAPRLLYHFVWK